MATAKKLTDNHLTCVICTEVFTDPATLQCNHTFCKSCLLKYTKTQPGAIAAKSVPCPSCKQQTKVTNPDSPVDEWVSQMKPSHVTQSLMDDFGPATEAPETRECSVCKNHQKQTPATSWCSSCDSDFCDDCLTLHGAMPFARNHEVVALSEFTKSKMRSQRQFTCKHHISKQIELFCKDCKMAICTICCSINHRKCNDVDTIENMTPQVKEQLTKRNQELHVRIGNIQHGISVIKQHGDDVRNKIEEAKTQIRNTRARVVESIMKKERQLLKDIDQSSTEYLQQIQSHINSKEIDLQMYQQQCEFTDNAVTSSCDMDMYALYESGCEESLDSSVTDHRPALRRVVFTHDMDKLRQAVDEIQLGDVKIVQDGCDRESVPILNQTIICKKMADMAHPSLDDVTVLAVDGIKIVVVVDYDNKRINTYYKHDIHNPKYVQLSNAPYGITQIANCQIAVSVPESKEIFTVKVYPDPSILSTIKTSKPYCALAYLSPSRLVAGDIMWTDILDMEGNVLKSFSPVRESGIYIHVTGNRNLIVSKGILKSLVSVTSEGEAVFTYEPTGDRSLEYPEGITTTRTGDILFADKDYHKVIQLTESGQFVRDVLTAQDGIDSPRGICFDTDGLLYVTCGDCVKVFRFERHSF